MRFLLVSTEDSSKRPIDIPDEIVVKNPKPKKIQKPNKVKRQKSINTSKSTQSSKSIIRKHGAMHNRNQLRSKRL